MNILQINTVYASGSTGKIAKGIHDVCVENGIRCLSGYRHTAKKDQYPDTIAVSSWLDSRIHGRLARYTMAKGCFSRWMTARFLARVRRFSPDVIHLHNLHGSYINIPLLFRFIKKHRIPVVWTLHDCWPFTGGCSHFTLAGCGRWQHGCGDCPCYRQFSASAVDFTAKVWKAKMRWFEGVENLTIVTPSKWLAGVVADSFLSDYPIQVIHNGIRLDVFKPTFGDIRKKYGIPEEKYLVLGVAFDWGRRKGLDVFLELANRLGNQYQIVLVGTDDCIDKQLPDEIISIHRTENQAELAALYTAADVFANPTREDNYPTVNLEALACGTPVITFQTGGSPEAIDETCGVVVNCDDLDSFEKKIRWICQQRPFSQQQCLDKSKDFAEADRFREYVELYRKAARHDR